MRLKLIGLLCFFVVFLSAVPALAFNDGVNFNDSTTSSGNHSTLKKKHLSVSRESGENSDDYNFIGVQGSLGLANQSTGGVSIDSSSRVRMMFGAYYERRFIPYFGLRIGMDYNQRGFSTSDPEQGVNTDYSVNYLEFPLQAKAQFPTKIVTPFVAVGPFLGIAVGKSRSQSFNGRSQDVPGFDSIISGVNFGLGFGGGVDFAVIRHLNIEVGARYSMGLINVLSALGQQSVAQSAAQNDGGEVAPSSVSLHLNDLQFTTGLSYSL